MLNLERRVKQQIWSAAVCVLMLGCGQANQPSPAADGAPRPDLSGMWSDPPATAVDDFCFMTCTDEGIARLNALLVSHVRAAGRRRGGHDGSCRAPRGGCTRTQLTGRGEQVKATTNTAEQAVEF